MILCHVRATFSELTTTPKKKTTSESGNSSRGLRSTLACYGAVAGRGTDLSKKKGDFVVYVLSLLGGCTAHSHTDLISFFGESLPCCTAYFRVLSRDDDV